ncbi:MAG TPA: response regulator transcription factor [Chloroflexota bacterium]|nr:response regulator transcription factor [Chloroflexota bacterium]
MDEGRQHILLIEDDPAIVSLVGLGLRYEGFRVTTAATGLDGLRAALADAPDLVVLDWMLPGLDGIEVCRRLRGQTELPIIMLTARDAVHDRVAGLEAGADDYLVKPFHFDELLARIRARLRRRLPPTNQLGFGDLTLDLDLHEAVRAGRRINLTATEFNLLRFLMRHPRRVLSKDALLIAVWGYDFGGDANIVEQYVRSLRQKLGQPQLLQTLRLAGYILREPDP